ncbi:MAG TPA: hypothetical protein DEO49_01235 [Sutterella sp.]|nr:hypothetical protein [Sutterella sp.]
MELNTLLFCRRFEGRWAVSAMLRNVAAGWDTIAGLKVLSMYPYYPRYRYPDSSLSHNDCLNRTAIWMFKGDYERGTTVEAHQFYMHLFARYLSEEIDEFFGDLARHLTLVCVPASSRERNKRRFGRFSEIVCENLSMSNGFDHVRPAEDGTPKHLGGRGAAALDIDERFFAGRSVLLFDDLITQGATMSSLACQLESAGAQVIGGITLGRTVH